MLCETRSSPLIERARARGSASVIRSPVPSGCTSTSRLEKPARWSYTDRNTPPRIVQSFAGVTRRQHPLVAAYVADARPGRTVEAVIGRRGRQEGAGRQVEGAGLIVVVVVKRPEGDDLDGVAGAASAR